MVMPVICLSVLGAVGLIGCLYGVYRENRRINSQLDNLSQGIENLFEGTQDNPSPFVKAIGFIADSIAERQALSSQAAIRGALGGSQRAMNQALKQMAYEEEPALAVGDLLPKSLQKNEAAKFGLQLLVNKFMQARETQAKAKDNGKPAEQVKFNF